MRNKNEFTQPSTTNKTRLPDSRGKIWGPFLALTLLLSSGWAQAQTLTSVQQAVVNAARNVNGLAPASHVNLTWNGRIYSTWQTDMAGGDGQRMRTAINRYAAWRSKNRWALVPSSLITAIQSDLWTYNRADGMSLVNRIISMYDFKLMLCPTCFVIPPQDDEQTLLFPSSK